MRNGKITGKIILCMALVFMVCCAGISHVHAATPQMRIHAIYMGNTAAGGDAVIVESTGEYLLMDMGTYEQTVTYVIPMIKKLGIKELSIYISHMHIDHYGAEANKLMSGLDAIHDMPGLKIKNLYLPDSSIGTANDEYVNKYDKFVSAYNEYGDTTGKVVRLKKGSKFSFGTVNAEVLGPLGTTSTIAQMGGSEERYQNNMSLVTMLTCGTIKYLTCGDAMDAQEKLLVEQYKGSGKLDADILKLSHHGTSGASSDKFIAEVTPTYSFAQNSSYTGYLDTGNKWKMTYSAVNTVRKYGFYYLIADEAKDFIVDVVSNKVTMYKSSVSANNKLSGWVTVKGSTGFKDDTTDKFYIGTDGKPYTGVRVINNKTYWFNANLIRGVYRVSDKMWNPLYAIKNTYRYFDTATGEMYVGFHEIDKKLYYFDSNGLRQLGSSSWKRKKINGNWYAFNQTGVIAKNSWKKYSDGWRYYGSDGKMYTGKKKVANSTYYFDTKTGCRLQNGFMKVGSYKYYFGSNGKMYQKTMKKIGKYRYYFDKYGHMVVKKIVTISGKSYYFDEKGRGVQGKIVKVGKYSYYFSNKGVMVKSKIQKVGKYRYYFDKKGRMVKGKTVVVNGKRYKIDKKGHIK